METTVERAYACLHPAEQHAASGFAPRRLAEFTTGRACAREALACLGLLPTAVPSGPAGDPTWPAAVVGSITHTVGYRAAAVGLAVSYSAIGIDAEPHLPLPVRVLHDVAGSDELSALRALPADGTAWDRVLFSAKESAYKAWFPSVRGEVLATEIVVQLGLDGHVDALIAGAVMRGRWAVDAHLVRTAVWSGR